MDIKINLTINNRFVDTKIPVNKNMNLVDFFFSLQLLLKDVKVDNKSFSTFDIYTTSFERIAIVSDNLEIYIADNFNNYIIVNDLLANNINTLEVIAINSPSVSKFLKEEKYLKEALDNYKFWFFNNLTIILPIFILL